jgi:hypothetical protein
LWSGFRTGTAVVADGSGDAVEDGAAALGGLDDLQIAGLHGVGEGLDGNALSDASEAALCLGEAEARHGVGPGGLVRDGEDGKACVPA